MILMTAANGRTGRHVLPRLVATGEPVRALDHSKETPGLTALGVRETVVGDMLDPGTLTKALAGVRAVLHVGPPVHPRVTDMGRAVIDAAVAAGVERFIYFSVTHPQIGALLNHKVKLAVEEYLLDTDLNYTILQPMHYMQNIDIPAVVREGVLVQMYDPDRRLSHVDLADVAEVAAKVAVEPGHFGATYELCGSDHISAREIAGIIGREAGRAIEVRQISIDEFLSSGWMARMGDYQKGALRRLFEYYGGRGILGNPTVLTWLLGRPPTSFAQYVRREMETGQ